jgi:hypothetical protein
LKKFNATNNWFTKKNIIFTMNHIKTTK